MSDSKNHWEYSINRVDPTPVMSGQQQYRQVVGATFLSLESAKLAIANVPALKDRPTVIRRRLVGDWEECLE